MLLHASLTPDVSREGFPVLTDKFQRDSFLVLVEAAGPVFGIGRAALATFRALARNTRARDWTSPDSEPVCYRQQAEVAAEIRLHPRTVRRHEHELENAGLIERRTCENGSRTAVGERGIVFSPAIRLLPQIRARLEARKADQKEAMELRAARSTYRRRVTTFLEEAGQGAAPGEIVEIVAALDLWPSAAELRQLPLEALRSHVSEAAELAERLDSFRDKPPVLSGREDENVRSHIHDSIEDFSVPGNPSPDHDCREGGDGRHPRHEKTSPSDQLTPGRVYRLASEDLKMRIDILKGTRFAPDWQDIVRAAGDLSHDLGISRACWLEAQRIMGLPTATIAFFITDARRDDPNNPVRNPGGHLWGMMKAWRQGKLNLVASLEGLSARRRREAP